MPNTVRFHRVLRASPEKVYRAVLDPDALVKWNPPNGLTAKVHHLDAKVGGTFRMSFTNFSTGKSHAFGGKYLELIPYERIRVTDVFDDPKLPGEMQTTYTLKKVSCGTDLTIVQEGLPDTIPLILAASAGKSRSPYWRNSWSPRSRIREGIASCRQ
jgi:uncharacterized protein YndB with AHSA1/START domain